MGKSKKKAQPANATYAKALTACNNIPQPPQPKQPSQTAKNQQTEKENFPTFLESVDVSDASTPPIMATRTIVGKALESVNDQPPQSKQSSKSAKKKLRKLNSQAEKENFPKLLESEDASDKSTPSRIETTTVLPIEPTSTPSRIETTTILPIEPTIVVKALESENEQTLQPKKSSKSAKKKLRKLNAQAEKENFPKLLESKDASDASTPSRIETTTILPIEPTTTLSRIETRTTMPLEPIIIVVKATESENERTTAVDERVSPQFAETTKPSQLVQVGTTKTVAESSTIDELMQNQSTEFVGPAHNYIRSFKNDVFQEILKSLDGLATQFKTLYENLRQYDSNQQVLPNIRQTLLPTPNCENVLPMEGESVFSKLPQYPISQAIKNLVNKDFEPRSCNGIDEQIVMNKIAQLRETGLTVENYADMLTMMIQIEDYASQKDRHCLRNLYTQLLQVGQDLYKFQMTSHKKPFGLIDINERIWVESTLDQEKVTGRVVEISSDSITFQTCSPFVYCPDFQYKIHFAFNRFMVRLEQYAVERVEVLNLTPMLFPRAPKWVYTGKNQELLLPDKRMEYNVEQLQAIQNIVHGAASHSIPYLLVGLPGTGKSQVIVESIMQLWLCKESSRILVCATSNLVVDDICLRLLNRFRHIGLDHTDMIRISSTARAIENIPQELREFTKFCETETREQLLQLLQSHRIVLTTLTSVGRFVRLNLRSNFFTHLFIDECETASEPTHLIPIAGICSSMGKIHPRIILAGDTQQLGPIFRCRMSTILNYGESMLERLSRNPIYDTLSQNCYSMMLAKNYRTHHLILKVPNDLFYMGKLEAFCTSAQSQLAIGLPWLPEPDFPLFVEHVPGLGQQQIGGYSWHNNMEVDRVLYYVKMVLFHSYGRFKPEDIGIVAAYKYQCQIISDALRLNGWPYITVTTAEQLQGQERSVIIISTVRTSPTLGFIEEPKRINVMLTRAITLTILIGDTTSLNTNEYWRHLIRYCRNNNALLEYKPQQ